MVKLFVTATAQRVAIEGMRRWGLRYSSEYDDGAPRPAVLA